jgi:hypothetical protein
MSLAARLVAFYFPQLHRIPENDRWWGEGFTDWTHVQAARPLYPGHDQPRVPRDGMYDQSQLDVVRRQVEQAREAGISALCHYHYWFDGKQLLETPTNLLLDHPELDIGFCLSWANETWSRRWDGQEHLILIQQTHPTDRARWALHFEYLRRAFTDPRALKVGGRPVFLIYRPQNIPALAEQLDDLRERAHRIGLPGLYLVAMDQSRPGDDEVWRHFDAQVRYEPFGTWYQVREREHPVSRGVVRAVRSSLPDAAVNLLQRAIDRYDDLVRGPTRIDYNRVWEEIIARPLPEDRVVFPGAFVDWDNTPRYRGHATIFEGANPETFERGLRALVDRLQGRPEDERLVFINAWNEWSEGCYLEPDTRRGEAWLDVVRRVAGLAAG